MNKILTAAFTILVSVGMVYGKEPERVVLNNVLSSSKLPECKIMVSNDLTYLGTEIKELESKDKTKSNTVIAEVFYFIKQDDNKNVVRLLSVSFLRFKARGWVFYNNLIERVDASQTLELGKTKFGEFNYHYATGYSQSTDYDTKLYIKAKDLTQANGLLMKRHEAIVSVADDRKIILEYTEPVPSDEQGNWLAPNLFVDSQKAFASEFIKRANASFQMLAK